MRNSSPRLTSTACNWLSLAVVDLAVQPVGQPVAELAAVEQPLAQQRAAALAQRQGRKAVAVRVAAPAWATEVAVMAALAWKVVHGVASKAAGWAVAAVVALKTVAIATVMDSVVERTIEAMETTASS